MSLVKVPFLLASAVGVHIALTPPHVSTQDERVKPTSRERILNLATALCGTLKGVYWLGALAESTVILLALIPRSRLPPAALALLNTLGGAENKAITPAFLVGASVVTLAGLLRRACYRELGRMFTFHISVRKDHQLVTSGPYSVVRHPSYTATSLCVLGVNMMHFSVGSWLRTSGVGENMIVKGAALGWAATMWLTTVTLIMRCPKEDAMMKKEFGTKWEEWAGRVRYWLIPGLY